VLTGLVAAIAIIPRVAFSRPLWRRASLVGTAVLLLGLAWLRYDDHMAETEGSEVTQRNFYGTLQVFNNV